MNKLEQIEQEFIKEIREHFKNYIPQWECTTEEVEQSTQKGCLNKTLESFKQGIEESIEELQEENDECYKEEIESNQNLLKLLNQYEQIKASLTNNHESKEC